MAQLIVRKLENEVKDKLSRRAKRHGRSVEEVELDEGALANNRMAFCSRILKAEQWAKYLAEIRAEGVTEVIKHGTDSY